MSNTPEEESNITVDDSSVLYDYRWPIIAALLVIVVAVGGFGWFQVSRAALESEARMAFLDSAKPEDIVAALAKYRGTEAAATEMLVFASSQADAGEYAEALKIYGDFLIQYPDHPLEASAKFGRASSLESLDRLDEALDAFFALADAKPVGPLTPLALVRAADLARGMNQIDKAKVALNRVVSDFPDSLLVPSAQTRLKELSLKEAAIIASASENEVIATEDEQAPSPAKEGEASPR